MSLAPIAGHQSIRAQLGATVRTDRTPQVLLVTGPRGVGKQRLALWLAQLLFCAENGSEPCGRCAGCTQLSSLTHPDLHWFVPVPTPKGDPDKQVDEVAGMLEGVMAERRASPFWNAPDGMSSHSVASARLIHRHATLTSVAGGWRIFIIGGADRLVPQASSPTAANSLLKLLEEPPKKSIFILTATEPGLVLPTIRSRSMPLRLGRLSADEVRAFFAAAKPDLATDAVVERANGSIGAAISAGTDTQTKARDAAEDFLAAVTSGVGPASERALRQNAWAARGEFTSMLDAMAEILAGRAKRVLEPGARVTSGNPAGMLAGVERVLATRERAQGNVNPQLLLATLADELAAVGAA